MTETESENRKRLKYEIEATVIPDGNFQSGYLYWPNGIIALSFWSDYVHIFNSKGVFIATWKVKSWK